MARRAGGVAAGFTPCPDSKKTLHFLKPAVRKAAKNKSTDAGQDREASVSLTDYIHRFQHLNVNQAHGRASPHKICMLLALLDLARSGALKQNSIPYDAGLLERYQLYFNAVKSARDHSNPYFPYFHLRSEGFWHLHAVPGREVVLDAMKTAASHKAILENVARVSLDEELFALLQSETNIEALGNALAAKWFDRGLQDLTAVVAQGKKISSYEQKLRDLQLGEKEVQDAPEFVRNPAFRRIVTEIYDYRCAATGRRLILPNGIAMVEAAHIHPFSEAADDDPRNGLALTPDMHWAMDKYLIAPGPDYKWHVSKSLDDRIPDYRILTDLAGKSLFLPTEQRMYPKRETLEWRLQRLA